MGADGFIFRRHIDEQPLEIGETVLEQLCSSVIRKTREVFEVPGWGVANLCIGNEYSYYTVVINNLPLKANFMVDDGILFPRFSASREPVMPMVWKPPVDMTLVMLVMIQTAEGKPYIGNQFLLALDKEQRAFKMPLGNLHEDGRLCSGEMNRKHPTAQAALCATMEQLEKGQWQGDLDRSPAETKKMFRYKAEASVFVQLPSVGPWQDSCIKISPNVMKFLYL